MGFIGFIIYGFISGIAELLPVSSQAHQSIVLYMAGQDTRIPLLDLIVHFGMLLGTVVASWSYFSRLRRDQKLLRRMQRKKRRTLDLRGVFDIRIGRAAGLLTCVGLIALPACSFMERSLLLLALFLCVNGILLYLPCHMRQGNKDSRMFSKLDSLGIGILGSFSVIPGISRTAAGLSYALFRGADRKHAFHWMILISIPAILMYILFDLIHIFNGAVNSVQFASVIGYLIAGVFSFIGAWIGVRAMEYLSVKTGFTGLAYYSWGTAMLLVILYLLT